MIIKSIMAMTIGFITTICFGMITIPLLRKIKANQSINRYLSNHKKKEGTATMGGLIFIIPTLLTTLILILMHKIHISYTLIIIIFTLFSYMLIGLIDDIIIIKNHNNNGLSKSSKLILEIIVATIFFYLFMKGGNEPLLWSHNLNYKINIGFLYGLFILFVLVACSNAVNLTDGLDGLATGLSIIAFFVFGIITWKTGWLDGYQDVAVMIFILIGSLLGFLIFNKYPAKVFMGDTGSLALGAELGAIAIMTKHELLLILIGFVFMIETISCIIQIVYYKLTKKRFFPMTPLHHSFEKMGLKEKNIVYIFWLIGIIAGICALTYGAIL